MFERALKSVVPCSDLFKQIVISINGKDGRDDIRLVRESGINPNLIKLFETKADFVSVKHVIWLAGKLKNIFCQDDRVVLLAHDDELIADSFRNWYELYPSYGKHVAWIGNYEVYEDQSVDHSITVAVEETVPPTGFLQPVSLLDWLMHNQSDPRGYVYTNMSGMSIPFGVYLDLISWQKWTFGKVGARFEYMLLSHKSISGIMGSKRPYVRIHEHPNQEGKNVPSFEYPKDEIRYCLWLLLNAKNIREFIWILKSPWGIRGLIYNIKSIIVELFRVAVALFYKDSK